MASDNSPSSFPRDPTAIEQHASAKKDFIPSGWVLLLVFAVVVCLFYLAAAARFADTTAVLTTGVVRPASPPIVIGEKTRPTQMPIR